MKKLSVNLFLTVLMLLSAIGAMAQTDYEITVDPAAGSYGSSNGNYCAGWTSNSTEYPVKIGVTANNMYNQASGCFEIAPGQSGSSTWTFTVEGYKILSYSFTYKLKESSSIKIVVNDTDYTVETSEKTLEVSGVDSQTASFVLSGDNKHVIITELKFKVREILQEGHVYRFVNARANRSLAADGDNDVHVKETDTDDEKQQWYVVKEGNYYVLCNLACGSFLKGNGQSAAWSMSNDYSHNYNKFTLHISNSTLNTLHTNTLANYAYMHDSNNGDNGGYEVVGWSNGNNDTGTHWTIVEVEYSAEQLDALLNTLPTANLLLHNRYQTALSAIFSDAACTMLNESYSSANMTDEQLLADANYIKLPLILQNMVKKVRGGDWSEDNAVSTKASWDSDYAKKFRVQMYEPYSIAKDGSTGITSWLGINWHANNDNPTGIYVHEAGVAYVMVEGEIADGASLRIVDAGSNNRILNASTVGTELHQGLNIVNFTQAGGMLYICYNVETYNPNGTDDATRFPHKLSDYAPLKIHIEGGAINGFYNACGDFRAIEESDDLWKTITGASVDDDSDWEYMETRANLNVLPILGHRETLLLQLDDEEGGRGLRTLYPDLIECPETPYSYAESWDDYGMGCNPETGKINIVMEAWDRIMYSQLATMGVVSKSQMNRINEYYPRWTKEGERAEMYDYDNPSKIDNKTLLEFCGVDYSEYFNHHGVVLGTGGGNPYGSGDHIGYPIGSGEWYALPNTAGSTWGPAHEVGHQHQGLLNLNGLTEVTNNLFANISLWYKGMSTSRNNYSEGSLESVLNAFNTDGSDIYTNNIWALTHLYYRLWLYYHLAGNNTQFYPRLFELLRHSPMQGGYNVSGDVSTLRFYKLACQAAGEDLTEFFRAHGYFSVMDARLVGDYNNSIYNVSQEMIDEAIAEVKAMRDINGNPLKENLAIIFINDEDKTANYLQHDGEASRVIYVETTPNSDFGSVSDFIAGNVDVTSSYTATLDGDGTVTMSGGEGGVGFLLLDENGKLLSFSNKSEFKLSEEAKAAIISGKAEFVAVDTKGNTTEVAVDAVAVNREILALLIDEAKIIVDKVDDTYTKVGFYKRAEIEGLVDALAVAEGVLASGTGYAAAYEMLSAEYHKVLENANAKIPFDPSLTYIITNAYYDGNIMYVNTSGDDPTVCYSAVSTEDATSRWQFKETATVGVYNIYNMGGCYCGEVNNNAQLGTTTEPYSNAVYELQELSDGVWAIRRNPLSGDRNIHAQGGTGKIIGWGIDSPASGWYLTAVEPNQTTIELAELQALMTKTKALVDEVATISYTKGEAVALKTTQEGEGYYLSCNAPETREGNINYLVDGITGDNNNYFHTDWSTEPTSGSHYLTVDFGSAANGLERFMFSYTTRSGAKADFPKAIDVYGSNDGSNYKLIGSVDNLPQTAGTNWEATDAMIAAPYQYLRFNVHANRGYWHMAEFDIYPVASVTATLRDYYKDDISVIKVEAAYDAYISACSLVDSASPSEENIEAKKSALENAYKALVEEYDAIIDARQLTLVTLVGDTKTLMSPVGTVNLAKEEPLTLTTENLYCNAPYKAQNNNDYSEEYVSKLTDKDYASYLHTDYSGTVAAPHYLRVDLGENPTVKSFKFNYATRDNGNNCPTTIVVEGCDEADGEYVAIRTQTSAADGLPNPSGEVATFESQVISSPKAYRYIRFKVTAAEGGAYFVMSEFGFTKVIDEVTVNSAYTGIVSSDLLLSTYFVTEASETMSKADNNLVNVSMLDNQIVEMQEAYAAFDLVVNQSEHIAAKKTELQSLIEGTQALLEKMTAEGAVKDYYTTSALTAENVTTAQTEVTEAQETLSSTEYSALVSAVEELQPVYDMLKAVDDAEYKGAKDDLATAAASMNELLSSVANLTQTNSVVPLQCTDDNASFYIWCNAPADDSNGVAGILDKNDDGSAKTGTFLGTTWTGGNVEPYTHYLEIDMGAMALNEFSFDYTTRDSDHANQRPTTIKVLASKDKEEYVEITTISEGLATGQNEKWEMNSTIALGDYYRYIRLAVATEVGYFNMSDFNFFAHNAAMVTEYYSTMPLDVARLYAMHDALQEVEVANSKYVTEDAYNAALANVQVLQNDLQALKALDYKAGERSEITELATAQEAKVNNLVLFNNDETVLQLQCTDENAPYYLYCNAPEKSDTYVGDNLGVAALLDMVDGEPNSTTHLHTAYSGNDADDDLDHYLRLDMGKEQAVVSFKFGYQPRSGGGSNAPKVILIEGCNNLENDEWDEIATLSNLPRTYQSGEITNGKAYRYIRFMVKDTHDDGSHNGHKFFALSYFTVSSCKIAVVKEYYSNDLDIKLVADAYNVKPVTIAQEVAGHYITEADYNTAYEKVQTAGDALQAFIAAEYTGDRTEYNNLVTSIKDLVEPAYEATELQLQCTDETQPYYLFCNAPGTTNNWYGDNEGVSAVIDLNDEGDPKLETYLHTTYYGNGYSDNLDHYLRVDMGENNSVTAFQFSCNERSGYNHNAPKVILIEGSNDLNTFEEIITLTGITYQSGKYQSGIITNGNAYRYIRFMVKETNDNTHPFFSMSHFTVSSCDIREYYSVLPIESISYISNACVALNDAQAVKDHYVTEENYTTALNSLQSAYNNLNDLMSADADRTALEQLIDDTEELISCVATITEFTTTVTLSAENVYCNADNSTNEGAGEKDKLGVAALFDGDPSTHLHTTYGGKAQDDDLDHYIRVDLGEGSDIKAFTFNYIGRNSNSGNDPKKILVQACNTIDGEWVTVKELSGLPTDGDAVEYTSPVIGMSEAYRYVRFMVTETESNSTTEYNEIEHKFFVLSEFGFTPTSVVVKDEYVSSVSPDLVRTAYDERIEALEANEYYMAEADYATALAELQAAFNALNEARLPVQLTTDANNPILYKIKINRGDTKRLQYDESDAMIAVVDESIDAYQAWYFMRGDNASDILVLPYKGDGKVLATNSFSEGNSKVKAVAKDKAGYSFNWNIVPLENSEWYNITILKGDGTIFYFSNHGGADYKMGFYNVSSDDGSKFKFVLDETDYTIPDVYYDLYNKYTECGGLKEGGSKIGQYKEDGIEAYNNAYTAAGTLLEDKTLEEGVYEEALATLTTTYDALEYNMPVEGKFYRLRSAYEGYSKDGVAYVGDNNYMYFSTDYDLASSRAIWQFEEVDGVYYLKSLHTGCYVNSFPWSGHSNLNQASAEVELNVLDGNNAKLEIKAGHYMHAANGGNIVGYQSGTQSAASVWYIDEVTEEVCYKLTITDARYSTLYLNFPVTIPEGVKAYVAEGIFEEGYFDMQEITGVIPAKTAAIINGAVGEYEFKYSTEANVNEGDGESNIEELGVELAGTLWDELIQSEYGYKYYVLSKLNGEVGLYQAALNYNEGTAVTEGGTQFKNKANKVYLKTVADGPQNSAFLLFRFNDGIITDIDEVEEVNEQPVIYDLQGRKISEISKPGVYIINGKKIIVK